MSYVRQSAWEDPMQVWGAVIALVILFLFIAWLFLPELVYATCLILHFLWGLIDLGPFHSFAAPRYNLLAETANHSGEISFARWVSVMDQTIGILWLFLVPLTAWSLWEWWKHPAQSRFTRRPLDISNLPHALAPVSPALTPVLSGGDSRRLFHGKKRPEQMPALTPEEFVEQHTLVRDMQLDVAATRACFMAQLGSPLTSWRAMAPHEKALFAVFGLQYFLGDRQAATGLMNALNLSCRVSSRVSFRGSHLFSLISAGNIDGI